MELNRFRHLLESSIGNVKPLVTEEEDQNPATPTFDFSEIAKKLWSDYFSVKNGFEFVRKESDTDIYSLKREGFTLVVGIKPFLEQQIMGVSIFLFMPGGERINFLEEVDGKKGAAVKFDEFSKMSELLQRAVDFGKAKLGYDNLPPLPRF